MACAGASIALFVLRGGLHLAGVDWRRARVLRVLPHGIDTVLLGAAIWLTIRLGQYPFTQAWLTAKLLALVAYVLLGRQALRAGQPRLRSLAFLVAALAAVGYIVAVALHHSARAGW